jgi:hypothetical protein
MDLPHGVLNFVTWLPLEANLNLRQKSEGGLPLSPDNVIFNAYFTNTFDCKVYFLRKNALLITYSGWEWLVSTTPSRILCYYLPQSLKYLENISDIVAFTVFKYRIQ